MYGDSLSGEVSLPEPLTPGPDDEIVEEGARLGCIGIPTGDVDIDILPPIEVIKWMYQSGFGSSTSLESSLRYGS